MGIGDRVGGRLKQAAGDLTGSEALRREGVEDERRADAKEELAHEQAEAERRQERANRKAEEVEQLEGRGGPEPIPGYDGMNADEVRASLSGLSDAELREVEDYELRNQNRKTVLDAIESKRI
jgi:uncharacterized protein YjbJ (UPF0337 family)